MRLFFKQFKNGDIFLLLFFNHKIKCKSLDIFMPLITYLGSAPFSIMTGIAALLSPVPLFRKFGTKALLSLLISHLIAQIIKTSVNRLRPFLKIENLNFIKTSIDEYSFPSGHTTAAAALAVMISLFFPAFSLFCLLLALLVGISRMYLGVHYPSDVLIGFILGTICSYAIYFLV